jgi:cellulose synthase/poly-beta-1,6-N-acetylglucosamine synthase-like glycosyltransferase
LEIIIGSDGSQDRTNEIIGKYAGKQIRLAEFAARRGKAAVLNSIAQMAQGEILIFSDANTMYRRDAVARLAPHFADAQVGGVCGRLMLLSQNGQIEAKGERFYWDYESYLKHLEGKIKTVLGANGAIYAIRRELFAALPAHKVVMDDFLIPLRVVQHGYDIVYDKDAVVCEFTAPNLRAEFKRKVRIGAANFHGIREILPLLNPLKGFVPFGLWSHKIIRWAVPFLLIAMFVANLTLLGVSFYNITFMLQAGFYLLALVAWRLDRLDIHAPFLVYPYYFAVVNLALLVGFFKFVTKAQKPAWARVER